jgi:hypothetical protein
MTEAFCWLARTPDALKFVRSTPAPPGVTLSATALPDRYVYGWTLTAEGVPVRLFYVRLDVPRDGMADFEPDPDYPRSTAGCPKSIKAGKPLLPIADRTVPEVAVVDEELQRAAVRKHWIKWHEEREDERRRDKQRANEEHERKVREQEAMRAIVVTPRPRPRPKPKTFWQRLTGK